MNEKKLGKVVFIEQQTASGTASLIVLAKMENVVLLDVYTTEPKVPGGPVVKEYALAPVGERGTVRFDRYDASTGQMNEGNDIVVEFTPIDSIQDGPSQKSYPNITRQKIDKMLTILKGKGYNVTGNNPWDVDVKQGGVKLRGTWNEGKAELTIRITDKWLVVSNNKVWSTIDPLIRNL